MTKEETSTFHYTEGEEKYCEKHDFNYLHYCVFCEFPDEFEYNVERGEMVKKNE